VADFQTIENETIGELSLLQTVLKSSISKSTFAPKSLLEWRQPTTVIA
jgi:hypothetical protein